jgi:recombination protein RecA
MAKKTTTSVLDSAMVDITNKYGPRSIVRLDSREVVPVDIISTGILPLDLALGCGGLPRGRIVEVYGPESSGKTTVALSTIAEAQRIGLTCAFIDVEHALDIVYAKALGVDIDELLLSQPDTAEEALDIVLRLAQTGEVGAIIVDSVAALVPRAEVEGDMGDAHVGLQARLMGQALRKLTGAVSNGNVLLLFLNQLRFKVGIIYGSPEVTSGGKALSYYSSVRIDIRRIETLKTGQEATANRTRAKIVKNKIASPYRQAEFDLVFGEGVPKANCLVDVAIDLGIIQKSGAWLTFDGETIGQGRANAAAALKNDATMFDLIHTKITQSITGEGKTPEVFGESDD